MSIPFSKVSFKIALLFLKRNIIVILIGVFLGTGIFLFRQKAQEIVKLFSNSSIKIGMSGKYTPDRLPVEITSLISFGLTKLSNNNSPEPAAAISWEVKNQGKQYLFHLDPLLHWQDKSPLKSKEVGYQIEGLTLSFPDDYTVVFDLEKPFAPLPALVAEPLFKNKLIGLGKYRVKKLRMGASNITFISLESNKKESFDFSFYPTQTELVTALKLGEVDCAWNLASVEELKDWNNFKISPKQESEKRYVALFFNTQKPPLNNKRLRQALAYSIRKPEESVRILTPISPRSWAYNKDVKTYPYDPDHAKKIMEEAGQEATGTAKLKIDINTTFDLSDWGEKIKNDWQNHLGIETNLKILPFISPDQDFDVILGYGIVSQDPDQYEFWHSEQPGNITKFSNPRIDKLLEEGRTTLNKEERKRIYKDFQRFLLEELPAIFLYSPTVYDVCRKGLPNLN